MCHPCSSEDGEKRGQQQAAGSRQQACSSNNRLDFLPFSPRHDPKKATVGKRLFFNLGTHHCLPSSSFLVGVFFLCWGRTNWQLQQEEATCLPRRLPHQCSENLHFLGQSLPEREEQVTRNPDFTLGNCKLNVLIPSTSREARSKQNDYLAESKIILGKGSCK